ncbi:tRNA-modifying protein YgfZ [Thalassotalea maritima]|uniref:tRNA-modifying protein YgfZ n=1 Tax=Thalassotalea maritima TaxID=3242416 RepID=UPI00352955BB
MNLQTQRPDLSSLPDSFAIDCNNISAISIAGDEADTYLQGQVTCDMNKLSDKGLLVGAHCDAKGKMFAAFRVINHFGQRLLIQSKASIAASMAQLQKYGVFAKVDIKQSDELAFLTLVGEQGVALIEQQFGKVPDSFNPVVQHQQTSIIYLAGDLPRYLIVATEQTIADLQAQSELPKFDGQLWAALEIQSGFVHLNEAAVGEYVPQMVNLQCVNGISFSKGCYMGQETVARMKYLGKNKRALFRLQGQTELALTIANDTLIEVQLGDNWRRGGNILAHYQADSGALEIQAVLASDTPDDAVLRLKDNPEVTLTIAPLPYSLNEH